MVVEAFVPGGGGERAVASTRMILQANAVKEKANKLKKSFGTNLFSGNESDSKNVLAMTLKQVVMEQFLSFQIEVFISGSERDFQDISKPQKVSVDFSISSSDEKLLSKLAEAVCSCAIEDARKNYIGNASGWFQKWQRSCSADSSICIYRFSEAEVVRNARRCLESFSLLKSSHGVGKTKHGWWPPPNYKRLGNIGGPEFDFWANKVVPAYMLQIDANAFANTKLEGRYEFTRNRWEVLLTHFQLVELGNVLDMYFEDQFTLPRKNFHSHYNSRLSNITKNTSYLNKFSAFLAGSCVIVFVGIVAQLCWPRLLKDNGSSRVSLYVSSSENYCFDIQRLDNSKLQAYCMSVVKKIKDSVSWPGDVMVDANIGAWVGELPDYFKSMSAEKDAASDDVQRFSSVSQENQSPVVPHSKMSSHLEKNDNTQETMQDIATFQVVISEEGKVIGFQPTSRIAVNHWATNPLTTILYEGRKLSPGFLEPRLKIARPAKAFPIEVLMSVNSESFFALARPVREPC